VIPTKSRAIILPFQELFFARIIKLFSKTTQRNLSMAREKEDRNNNADMLFQAWASIVYLRILIKVSSNHHASIISVYLSSAV
jgi:ferric iron reductase protein FhuF